MVPFTRYQVRVGGHALHVMEHGEGLPVLMVHGNPSWGFLWRKVALALGGAPLRLVMPDLLGLGLSDKPTDPAVHTLEKHSELIGGVVDALGLDRLILVVQDWGGAIGGHAMASRAERVRGLVVLNTVLGSPRVGFRPTSFHRFARLPVISDLVFRTGGFMPRGMKYAQGDRSSITGDVARAYRWVLRDRATRVAPLALARMVPNSQEHPSIPALRVCEQFVQAFKGPSEIVWGDRDPVLAPAIKRLRVLLPNARVTRTQGGHFLQEEVPDEIAAAIRRVAEQA
jgi:cis-3-alkyl-4-acyloxetan-2-one decarboxylase